MTSNGAGEYIFVLNPGTFNDPFDANISQVFLGDNAPLCIADLTTGISVSAYGWTEPIPNPLSPIDFIQKVRLVSQSFVFTYTGNLLLASGSLNLSYIQTQIFGPGNIFLRSGVDLSSQLVV